MDTSKAGRESGRVAKVLGQSVHVPLTPPCLKYFFLLCLQQISKFIQLNRKEGRKKERGKKGLIQGAAYVVLPVVFICDVHSSSRRQIVFYKVNINIKFK
jgi:hypothetical protein